MGPGNRPLDLEWLEDFVALASTGSFSRAAEARAIAQPALSRHIRALEEWVGVDLVDRGAHPASLTAAGRRFLPLIEDTLARLIAARIKARIAHDRHAASLRIAATHALSLAFFPAWLKQLEASLPLGAIEMMSDSMQACEEMMAQRRVQFLLAYGHRDVPGRLDEQAFPHAVLGGDELVPLSAPDGAGQARHRLDAGGGAPLLAYAENSGLGKILRHRLGARLEDDTRQPAVFTGHHAHLLKTLALDGRGVAWLPRSLAAEHIAAGRLVEAGDASWRIPLDIRLYRQPAELADAAEALWRLLCVPDGLTAACLSAPRG